ncbi:NADH-quinone oxidoreductase subunit C [Jiulongibacter sediminis]|jgi:NADH-quinone oxidoreductase subunit C|uniref:NADH-quinone oxidoreductase subunit C n=1 Tax=Jiulongibacter sediminis TaxID=1605367 RepID=UPI0026F05723|nr:NADH-quinone oxidoreductase subunit C [Jiulongibacter sediminis]
MDFSAFEHIATALQNKFGEEIFEQINSEAVQPYVELKKDYLLQVCSFLYKEPEFYFDFLNCISAVDNGPETGTLELWYHLSSIPNEKSFIIKVTVQRGDDHSLPEIDSLTPIWKTADWHEREAFDLVGVKFNQHPDLRRILLPADWHGHPLRKDHVEQEKYHGIKVKY